MTRRTLAIGAALAMFAPAAALGVLAHAAGAASTSNLSLVNQNEDYFRNYDFTAQVVSATGVDWAVDLVFKNNATINKVKNGMESPYDQGGTCASGQNGRLNDGAGYVWDSDSGKKTTCCPITGDAYHFRVYADADDRMYNSTWGYYVFGTTHIDHAECGSGSWFGYSENAEGYLMSHLPAGWSGTSDALHVELRAFPSRREPLLAERRLRVARQRSVSRAILRSLASAGLLALLVPSSSAAAEPLATAAVSPDRVVATLESLRRGALEFGVAKTPQQVAVDFVARQVPREPTTFHLVRLHVLLRLAEGSGPGFAVVSAATNGKTAAQIEIVTQRAADGRLRTNWSSLDLTDGVRRGEAHLDKDIEISMQNYARVNGIHAGKNTLTFRLETYDELRFQSAEILPDSGVLTTSLGPARLSLRVETRTESLRPGRTFSIPFVVENRGGRAARDVVAILAAPPGIEVVGRKAVRARLVHDRIRGEFRVKPARPGEYELTVGVTSENANRPYATVKATVEPAPSFARAKAWPIVALLTVIGGPALIALAVISRPRGEPHDAVVP